MKIEITDKQKEIAWIVYVYSQILYVQKKNYLPDFCSSGIFIAHEPSKRFLIIKLPVYGKFVADSSVFKNCLKSSTVVSSEVK